MKYSDLKPLDKIRRDDYDSDIIIVKISSDYIYTSIGAIPKCQIHLYTINDIKISKYDDE